MRARAVLALVVFALCSCEPKRPAGGSETGVSTTFFDVGQGDAALLRTAEATVLIDTGHNGEIVRLLRREGVKQIDLLILSHPHADHVGGFAALSRSFPVRELWYAGDYHGKLREALAAYPSAEAVVAGKVKIIGRLSLTVLHPDNLETAAHVGNSAVNNGSVVVKAVYRDNRYLFPGDCELGCWEELFKLHRPELRAGVLKLAHHGSWNGTNSGVLVNVRPATVIVSCGRNNGYGHPSRIVLTMLEKLGAKIFRTDQQGTIRCEGVECAPVN